MMIDVCLSLDISKIRCHRNKGFLCNSFVFIFFPLDQVRAENVLGAFLDFFSFLLGKLESLHTLFFYLFVINE